MWIVRDLEKTNKNVAIFCKKFHLDKPLKKGVLKISALGIFNVKINGCEIEEYFMPGWTNYNKYVYVCTYDVTKFLKEENLLEITVAEGWYSGRLGYGSGPDVYGAINALWAELLLAFQDGSSQSIVTDETWKVGDSQIVKSSFFDGETVDFSMPSCKDSSMSFAKAYGAEIEMREYAYEPVVKIECLKPDVLQKQDGIIRLDFKQNFAGFISFTAKGKKGTEVIVKHAEVLNDNGMLYFDNLRSAKAEDRIILSGGVDYFEPKFTFHGFRYAEICFEGEVEIADIKGVVLSQDLLYGGKFECSNEIINAVYRNALWGQKGNFISIPTDCPQRDERLGWAGDAQIFCNSAMFNSDCNRFFRNYLRLIQTDILPDGKVPSFVPFFIPVSVSTAGVPGWADAICVIPYYHYLHYQDKDILRENLPFCLRHFEYYLSKSENYLLKTPNAFGDWLSVERADDAEVISQCFFALTAKLISKMFIILGQEDEAQKYEAYYHKIRDAFRKNYLYTYGKIKGDTQTIYAFALMVGLVGVDEIKSNFIATLEKTEYRLTTGFIGVKYLLPALCEIGEIDLAYKIMKETSYPSWGYTIQHGATTIWERWNGYTEEKGFETPSMNSFNHYSLGACVEWLYTHVLGIKLSESGDVCIAPALSPEITYAKGEYNSCHGKICVDWKYADGRYYITVSADANVHFGYNFGEKNVLSVQMDNGVLCAVVE
jgi:alpha-L-rhamnosidase